MAYKFKNFEEFVQASRTNTALQAELKADPPAAMDKVTIDGELPNTPVYRMLIIALMITVLLIVSGVLVMALTGMAEKNQNVLTIFTAIASTAIGALAGVLMPVQKKG
jgi:heme/copper-type cytochrome/quinol oxidase subunit 3